MNHNKRLEKRETKGTLVSSNSVTGKKKLKGFNLGIRINKVTIHNILIYGGK